MGKDLKGKELGEGLCQAKDGRYLGRYTDGYGKRHSIYGRKLKDVKEKLNKAVYESKMGLGKAENASNMIFDELYKMWFEHKMQTIKISTCATYAHRYNKHIKDKIGFKKITEIERKHIEALFNDLAIQSNSYTTAQLIKVIIYNIFSFAVDKNLLLNNPCERVHLPKNKLREKAEKEILTEEQQKIFIEFAKKENYRHLPLCKFMLLTGVRINEATALTWEDINFKDKKVSINKTFARTGKLLTDDYLSIQTPKTKTSRREIPLCSSAVKLLNEQKLSKYTSEKWVFSTPKGTPINDNSVLVSLKKLINKITAYEKKQSVLENREFVPFPQITPHSFRHTFATRCFEKGIPPKVVQKYLGHSTLAMTMDLYTHVEDKLLEENIFKIDNMF